MRDHLQELNQLAVDKSFFVNQNTNSILVISLNAETNKLHYSVYGNIGCLINSVTELLVQRPDLLKHIEKGI